MDGKQIKMLKRLKRMLPKMPAKDRECVRQLIKRHNQRVLEAAADEAEENWSAQEFGKTKFGLQDSFSRTQQEWLDHAMKFAKKKLI
jgi:hypothetical protein